jgi:hypothetical protein
VPLGVSAQPGSRISIGVTSSTGPGLYGVPGEGVYGAVGVWLCRIVDMNFGELPFYALE